MIEVTVVVSVPRTEGRYYATGMGGEGSFLRMYLWWSFCPLCLLTFQATVTIGD